MMRFLTRFCAILALVMIGSLGAAQTPNVTVSFEEDSVAVGQPFVLRMRVLVPTFMPQPPVFPTFETPGLIIKLPSRSSSPISEKIDGASWAGVSRTYRIYPTKEGPVTLPVQDVVITYKDLDTNEEVRHVEPSPEVTFTATIPEAARGLNPMILANGLQITQEWDAPEGELAVGDAVVRRLKATINGTSALFIPDLLAENPVSDTAVPEATPDAKPEPAAPPSKTARFATYPQEPTLQESFDRGILSGTRSMQATYIAQTGGTAQAPDINLSWFNLKDNAVETISLPGRAFDVAAPPPPPYEPDPKAIAQAVLIGALAIAALWAVKLFAWPHAARAVTKLRSAYDQTPHAARKQAVAAARSQDLTAVLAALTVLETRLGRPDAKITKALRSLTHTRYSGPKTGPAPTGDWRRLADAIRKTEAPLGIRKTSPALPPLNPASQEHPGA